ncbi:MAG: DNA methylase [Deltaproteobacteria bacterium]|nr:DNA methylase [Deltaproteobacteria bacterium]
MTRTYAQGDLGFAKPERSDGPVECLGMTFESDEARRAHFLGLLREKLQDPEFRKAPGFPKGSDEAILQMSDPPYYTACPNPFITDFFGAAREAASGALSETRAAKSVFVGDISADKGDPMYRLSTYYTKVPPAAIEALIAHYSDKGDVVLDPFCGSGMTGVAALRLGRYAILSDLSPLASLITYHTTSLSKTRLARSLEGLKAFAEALSNRLYQDAEGKVVSYAVWSEQYVCESCGHSGDLYDVLPDFEGETIRAVFACEGCGASISTRAMKRRITTEYDALLRQPMRSESTCLRLLSYTDGRRVHRRVATPADIAKMSEALAAMHPRTPPEIPYFHLSHERNNLPENWGITHLHHFYTARNWAAISHWMDEGPADPGSNLFILSVFHENSATKRNRFYIDKRRPKGSPIGPLSNTLYVPSLQVEANIGEKLVAAIDQTSRAIVGGGDVLPERVLVSTGSATRLLEVPDDSVDYIFTDPPFGANINYSEQSFLLEWWSGVETNSEQEAITNTAQKKGIAEYRALMTASFKECARVLKPGKWMTVEFSNSSNEIWHAVQAALEASGLVVASVGVLDKGAYTLHQDHKTNTVDRDLIISAYKATVEPCAAESEDHGSQAAWDFVRERLSLLPVFISSSDRGEIIVERLPRRLLDRMIAFFVQRGIGVPLSSPDFLQGLAQRFPERDGMYFLPDQVAEYDRKRTSVSELRQLSLFVNDEASAIHWARQQLHDKPQSFQDLQPQFMRELQAWAKHERTVELKTILEQSFLHYDGRGPVPSQIHRYLSSNYKDLRNLEKDDPRLVEKARDRWYVPDPSKQAEREALREKALLREFDEYKTSPQRKLKVFRTEAVRVGFKACWQERDYGTIVKVAEKLPDAVLQEDEKLLMYYDNALTRLGDE